MGKKRLLRKTEWLMARALDLRAAIAESHTSWRPIPLELVREYNWIIGITAPTIQVIPDTKEGRHA